MRHFILFISIVLTLANRTSAQSRLLLEAENFSDRGGWVTDQQSMDQMGSAYLMAHGLGEPVEPAVTQAVFPATGTYHLYVRNRDWVPGYGPGAFRVTVNGILADSVFGVSGDGNWAWHYGGTVSVSTTDAAVSLIDSTGFNGRCDALYFTTAAGDAPPDGMAALHAFRRTVRGLPAEPPEVGTFDLVVVGGGMAGACAAIAAARQGLSVALIQNRPMLGGNNSSDVRVKLDGDNNLSPFPLLGSIGDELDPGYNISAGTAAGYKDDKKKSAVLAEANIALHLNEHVYAADTTGGKITAVYSRNINTGHEKKFSGTLFADCTGDGNLGWMAGADFRFGREGRDETAESMAPATADSMTMGSTNHWKSTDTGSPAPFPATPWALQFSESYYHNATGSSWQWESGFTMHTVSRAEQVRDHNLRAIFGNWSYLKNNSSRAAQYVNRKLEWIAYISGKRESRRLLGDHILTQQDIQNEVPYPDGCFPITWHLDLHVPDPTCTRFFPGEEFIGYLPETVSISKYNVPYRCLYSRNIGNLFMAGRCISTTHVGLGAVRVMRTTGMMGEVVGLAASVCKTYGGLPRDVYENHLDDLFARIGGTPPDTGLTVTVDNLDAATTGTWTSSTYMDGYYGTDYYHDNDEGQGTKSITFTPDLPQAGYYEVYLRWNDGSARADNVPVFITHTTGTESLTVNMKTQGAQWVLQGRYAFDAGTTGALTLTNTGTNGYVIADAARWVYDDTLTSGISPFPPAQENYGHLQMTVHRDGSVEFETPEDGAVKFEVTDITGRTLFTTAMNRQGTGAYRIPCPENVSRTGVYIFRLQTPDGVKVVRQLILK